MKEMKTKTTTSSLVIVLTLAFIPLLPKTQAVSPAPDGGYAGGNTAEGQNALLSLTTGTYNTAVGLFSLESDATGRFNTGVGAGALLTNTADQNTASGAGALFSNTTGAENTANGAFALFNNSTGAGNTAVGSSALLHNTTGNSNTAVGNVALQLNNGDDNTALGAVALQFNTTGGGNTAVGFFALSANSGAGASSNTAVGDTALGFNGTGAGNTAVGANALCCADAGNNNTIVGSEAMSMVIGSTGNNNTAIGGAALNSATASNNTAIGYKAGFNQTDGSNNVYIGADIQGVAGESDTCRIKSIFGQTAANGSAVFITSGNKLGTDTSSKRFKEEIKPMNEASEALLALKPVTFRYKKEIDPGAKSQFGLVAEDVEKVNPDLVVRDEQGKPYSVRYDQVNAMLLNEFLKAHRRMEDQQKQIDALTAQLKEQATEIQNVRAQVGRAGPAPQTVANVR
jgi:Chaperone of endosialidase